MSEDAIAKFKEAQREGWKHFAPLEALTTPAAARLVKFAKVRAGDEVLDVACGTGVVAITAARLGAAAFPRSLKILLFISWPVVSRFSRTQPRSRRHGPSCCR